MQLEIFFFVAVEKEMWAEEKMERAEKRVEEDETTNADLSL